MNQLSILFLLAFSLLANLAASQTAETSSEFDPEYAQNVLSREINRVLQETGIPSISLALIKDDAVLWSGAFGYTNVHKKVPATSTTIYSTGSNFKFVTATAIMQLAEAGKLDIDDPVNKYLGDDAISDLSDEGKPVTFRHLLSHHSGLSGLIEIIPIWEKRLPKSLEKVAAEVKSAEDPGINFTYCNHCYALAGLAIEKITGLSYEEYIVENILKPLKIESDGPVEPSPKMVEELALPYSLDGDQPIPIRQSRFDVYPAGDIYLTSPEMANFLIAQLNEGVFQGQSILSPASVAAMHEPQFGSNYGLGTGVIVDGDKKALTHTGGVPGFSTLFKVETETKTGYYLASNANNVHNILTVIGGLCDKVISGEQDIEPLASLAKKKFEEIQLPKETLERYVGKYQLTPDFFITVSLSGDQLFAQATGQAQFPIFPYEKDKFFLKIVYAQIGFNLEKGEVVGLTLFQNGESEGKKIE